MSNIIKYLAFIFLLNNLFFGFKHLNQLSEILFLVIMGSSFLFTIYSIKILKNVDFEMDRETGEPSPYVHVRSGLEALIDRKSFYRLVDLCDHETVEGLDWFGVYSKGQFFPIILSKELNEAT